ncbi:serine/threonine protein kinase [Blastopirellula marina]|uniref:non-specific serine/threonine protein kinase n=1 Tax=Blastopirellula marina TaxID=124 RepID=A0A2S8GIQ0_9BACT|nr:serine/threonine-protein kinase [Blastopirellula marina]PQO44325.1 hypothetical protein C5Y93_20405 [Blastopirellula marina]
MKLDDQVLDLLRQWEETILQGGTVEVASLASGDPRLAKQLRRHAVALQKLSWLDRDEPATEELRLPSTQALKSALLLREDLDLPTFQASLAKADIVEQAKLDELLKSHRVKSAYQLAGLLLEANLLTRFQLRAIAHGRTRGLRLGRYLILDKIGEGGMGQVFKARHNRMDREVAIKVLPRDAMTKQNGLERFYQEVQVAALLRHGNIVTAYDADEAEGLHFFVMEYVDGRDLSSIVQRQGPLSLAKAVNYVMQAAQGLEYAHETGLVHRDIKPANLLLSRDGVVKILDMGIARMQSDADTAGITQNGTIMGTIDFMAPEQAIDAKTVTPSADLYSLGCTLYYLLTARPPFEGDTMMAKLLAHREQSPPPLSVKRNDVPTDLEAIYQKCLAKQPADRYSSAAQLLQELQLVAPQLSDDASTMPYVVPASEIDTDSAGVLATLLNRPADTAPSVAVDLVPKTKPRTKSKQGASIYGGGVVVGLLMCGMLYFAAGMVLKLMTPDGTLIVEVDSDDFVAHIRGRELKLVNSQTQSTYSIQLLNPREKQTLPPGDYKLLPPSSSGVKTNVEHLKVVSDAPSTIKVSWEAAPVAAAIADSQNAAPAKPDYAKLEKGAWISLLTSQAEFDRLVADRSSPLAADERATFEDGVLTVQKATFYFPPIKTDNFLYRARISHNFGECVILKFRQANRAYSASWKPAESTLYFHEEQPNRSWLLNSSVPIDRPLPNFFEFAIASEGPTLRFYVDGKEVHHIERETPAGTRLSVGLSTSVDGHGQFKEIQLMTLGENLPSSNSPGPISDEMAAKRFVALGAAVQINHGIYATNASQFPSPPFTVTGVSLNGQENLTDDDLACFADCRSIEWINLYNAKVLTGQSLSYFKNCVNLRVVNLNTSPNIGSGLFHLADCKQIEELQLWSVKLSLDDILPVADRKFNRLNLGGTSVTDDWIPHFTQVESLDFLNFRYTRVSDKGMAHFEKCQKITDLSLGHTRVTDAGLACFRDCRDLQKLIIAESAISDASVDLLCSFSQLKSLQIQQTKITPAGVEKIRQALPKCEIVWDEGTIKP